MNRSLLLRCFGSAALLGALALLFFLLAPTFGSVDNIRAILRHTSANGLAALGLTFVIVVRKNDLSFPGILTIAAMTVGWLIANDFSLTISLAGGLAVGLLFGAVNGVLIGIFGVPDIIATIAIGSIALGLSYLHSNGSTISDNFMSSGMIDINDAKVVGIDKPVFILLLLVVLGWLLLQRSRFGRAFYAVGENPRTAAFSGISVRLYVVAAFLISAALASGAGILHIAASGQTDVNTGTAFLMPAYASVFLGAALFGVASAPATLVGALLMSIMLNGFTLLSMPYYYSDAIVSTILVGAVAIFDPRFAAAFRKLTYRAAVPGHST